MAVHFWFRERIRAAALVTVPSGRIAVLRSGAKAFSKRESCLMWLLYCLFIRAGGSLVEGA